MKKIVGFRLNLLKRDILRHLKNDHGVSEPTPEMLRTIEKEVAAFPGRLKTAVVFKTFSRQHIPQVLDCMLAEEPINMPVAEFSEQQTSAENSGTLKVKEDVQLALWDDCVAVSFCAVTIGEMPLLDNAWPGELKDSFIVSSLDAAERFIYSLIKDEAQDDDCGLGPMRAVKNGAMLKELLHILDYSKINISVHDNGSFQPLLSRFILINWIPT